MKKIFLIIISFALIFFFSVRIKEDLQRYRLLTDEAKSLEKTKSNIQKEEEKTQQLLEKEKQEEILEQQVRLMLGLKKSGEEVIMVLPINDSSNVVEQQNGTSSHSLVEESSNSFISKISQIWYSLITRFKR